jgi:hypothetical protein
MISSIEITVHLLCAMAGSLFRQSATRVTATAPGFGRTTFSFAIAAAVFAVLSRGAIATRMRAFLCFSHPESIS